MRFRFAHAPIDSAALAREVRDVRCGGYAAFEGWVRNHNEGQRVTRLEYEAFEALAVKEGERIIDEACRKFGVENARCVHRVGALDLTEIAVWVGVSAPHRDEAFRACRYIIDEVKHRVPIWKKEHYENGDSGWVNCERCAAAPRAADLAGPGDHAAHDHDHEHHHHHDHSQPHSHAHDHAQARSVLTPDYSRQMQLKEVGVAGQARLRASSVLVVGAGGLGVPVLQYLAGAGVGRLGIVDHDRLDPSNLHRQTWYALADCGQPKAQLAAQRIHALNPDVRVEVHVAKLTRDNAAALAGTYDLIIDCTDNFAAKFLLNDLAAELRKPVLFASVYQFEGQLQLVRGGTHGACLRCVWPEATRDGLIGNCAEAGVLGPVPGVFGSLQALEALKLLLQLPQSLGDEVIVMDLLTFATTRIRARRAPACHNGSCARSDLGLAPDEAGLEVTFESVREAQAAGYRIIDIRDLQEVAAQPLDCASVLAVPMQTLLSSHTSLESSAAYLLVCARGTRSLATAAELARRGFVRTRSLRGGVAALATQSA